MSAQDLAILIDLALLTAGCALLYFGADRLITGSLKLGRQLGLSQALTGLVIIAIGTSLPELAVAIDAAIRGHGLIAVGSVVGSNIVNITLVLGAGALIGSIPISRDLIRREFPVLTLVTAVSVVMLGDFRLTRFEGLLLTVSIIAILVNRLRANRPELAAISATTEPQGSKVRNLFVVLTGVFLLVAGAEAMVASGIGLARDFGVSEALIALTVTAIGTGIPEIAATILAIARRHHLMVLGTLLGSNLINLGLVLGLSALIAPMDVTGLGWTPLLALMAATAGLWLLVSIIATLNRFWGISLLGLFAVYQVFLII